MLPCSTLDSLWLYNNTAFFILLLAKSFSETDIYIKKGLIFNFEISVNNFHAKKIHLKI